MGAVTQQPFIQTGNTVLIGTITSTSQSAAITPPRPRVPLIPGTMLVVNVGTDTVAIGQGPTAPTVSFVNGTVLLPNTSRLVMMLADTAFVGAVGLATGSSVYFVPGQGGV